MACPNRRLGSSTRSKTCATGCQRSHNSSYALVCAAGIKVRARELLAVRDLSCTEGE